MKNVAPASLLILAVLAGAALIACVSALPGALGRVGREPEDVYILGFLSIFCGSLSAFWAVTGVRMLRMPAARLPRALRLAAWVVLLIGCAVFASAVFAFVDLGVAALVAGACVLGAAAVLSWGTGPVGT